LRGNELFLTDTAACRDDEEEIERLVLASLEFAQANPDQAVIAAKLLYFVNQEAYRDLASELAENALKASLTIASSLAVVGQMRAFLGRTGPAVEALEQAAALSEQGSEFHIYSLACLCQALVAADDRVALAKARRKLNSACPLATFYFDLLFSDPDKPSLIARGSTMLMSRAQARATLQNLTYISARLFVEQQHRENTLRLPLRLFRRRFGDTVIPPEVSALLPALLD
jgi:hypothetical protein